MEKKIAVYVCTGCGIGDALDIEQLSKVATEEESIPICRNHPNLCGQEGVELIKKDMADEGVNTMAIAACSHRVMYDVFDFEECIVDRVNLREQVVWSQEPGHEDDPQRQCPPQGGGDKEEEGADGRHHEECPRRIESAVTPGLVGEISPEGRDGEQGDG